MNNRKVKAVLIVVVFILIVEMIVIFLPNNKEEPNIGQEIQQQETTTIENIEIIDKDGKQTNYTFVYKNETFNAEYTPDNWKIIDSYKITNEEDIKLICEKLIQIHKVHGSDMKSYRTASDMAYEWTQHNLAYLILPDTNSFKQNAKDVDLDPKDQNKSLKEMYEDRTGKEFKLEDFLK